MLEALIGLIMIGAVGYVIYFVYAIRAGYRQGVHEGRIRGSAARAARGDKPVGKPFYNAAFGGAYFPSTEQLIDKGIAIPIDQAASENALTLGYALTNERRNTKHARICYSGDGHLITVAPTRAGKGIYHLVPNLLRYPGPVIVVDVKGEAYRATGKWRSKQLGCKVFAPFDPEVRSSSINPVDFVRKSTQPLEDSRLLADMLVVPVQGTHDPFWHEEAKALLAGIILHVATSEGVKVRTLAEVRRIVALPEKDFIVAMHEMQDSSVAAVRRTADSYFDMEEKVKSSVRAQARSQTHYLDSEKLAAVMGKTTMNFADLRHLPTGAFYLVIPPDQLPVLFPVLRMLLAMAITQLQREKSQDGPPVLVMIDEFPQLGHMKPIAEGLRYLAGYNVQLWLFAQDLGALRQTYGDDGARTILSNCDCRSFFGTTDYETAKLVSDMTGDMTIALEQLSRTQSRRSLTQVETSASASYSHTGRPLLSPDEILHRMASDQALVFMRGERPILSGMVPWFEIEALVERSEGRA